MSPWSTRALPARSTRSPRSVSPGRPTQRRIEDIARQVSEVQQYFTISGDPDALLRFRVRNVEHLQKVVNAIRATGLVAGTKALIVMSSWDRSGQQVAPDRAGAAAHRTTRTEA